MSDLRLYDPLATTRPTFREGFRIFFFAGGIVLLAGSILTLPIIDVARGQIPADMTAAEQSQLTRRIVAYRALVILGTPVFHLLLTFLEGVILWIAFAVFRRDMPKISEVVGLCMRVYVIPALGRLTVSVVVVVTWLVDRASIYNEMKNPLSFSALAHRIGVPSQLGLIAQSIDIFTVVYLLVLLIQCSRLFRASRILSSVLVLSLAFSWLYLSGAVQNVLSDLRRLQQP